MTSLVCTVLLIPGGGFAGIAPVYATDAVQATGASAVTITYPVHDVPAAMRAARQRARDNDRRLPTPPRKIVAYGESAGGAIAAWLAAKGEVDAAVSVSGPTNFKTWAPRFFQILKPWSLLNLDGGVDGGPWRWSPRRIYHGQRPIRQIQHQIDHYVHTDEALMPQTDVTMLPGEGHAIVPAAVTEQAVEEACA